MQNKSFTLIELLVVIVIIGILAGVIMISTSSSIDKANFAKAQTFSNTVQEELLLNLVSEWTFDEGTDQTIDRVATNNDVKDTWGSNNGTVYGNPQIKGGDDCVYGKCMNFDGVSYIYLGNPQDFKNIFPNNDWTISAWTKPGVRQTNENGGEIFSRTGRHILLRMRGTTSPYFYLVLYDKGTTQVSSATTAIPLNQWTFIVTERRGRDFLVHVNGDVKISLTLPTDFDSFAIDADAYIGQACCSTYKYTGLMDDIRIYDKAISTSEIKQNYIAGLNSMLANGNISNKEYNERINELAYDK